VERILTGRMREGEPAYVAARERSRNGDTFVYDLDIFAEGGGVIEAWRGLRLRKMRDNPGAAEGPAVLLGPYLERRVGELLPGSEVRFAVQAGDDSDRLFARLLPRDARAYRRADGKPEVAGGEWHVSASHAAGLVMAVASRWPVGCDLEPVEARSAETWKDLLGGERFALASLLAAESHLDAACTRVWTVIEALKKAGAAPGTPLRYDAALFSAGRFRVAALALARAGGFMAAVAIET
jgi:enediyne polyketide synthase